MKDQESVLLADGEKLLLKWPGYGKYFFLDNYYVMELSLTPPPTMDITGWDDEFRREIVTGSPILDIHIRSYGFVQSMDIDKAEKFFRPAESMSVNELLALAYQKLNNRES